MQYLDFEQLETIDERSYQAQEPFPWANPEGLLTAEGYARLRANLPDINLFESSFGVARRHAQTAHDRYILEYDANLPVDPAWHAYVGELRSKRYKRIICRLLGERSVALNFHWHYTPRGCAVSPHADSVRKAGSHIFYFNTAADWDPNWGGHTVLLDDAGQLSARSSPSFEDFGREIACEALGNRSLLFTRGAHAWHGVRPIDCPEGKFRKVFIVVINKNRLADRSRRLMQRRRLSYY